MAVSVKVIKRLEKEITDTDLEANSVEGVANALDKTLRTHELLTGNDDNREGPVHSGPDANVMRCGLDELISRIGREDQS